MAARCSGWMWEWLWKNEASLPSGYTRAMISGALPFAQSAVPHRRREVTL